MIHNNRVFSSGKSENRAQKKIQTEAASDPTHRCQNYGYNFFLVKKLITHDFKKNSKKGG